MTARQRADRLTGLAFVSPALLALAALAVYPGLWVLWLSLQQRIPIFGIARFVGLQHYVFLAGDARFWNAVRAASHLPSGGWRQGAGSFLSEAAICNGQSLLLT